MKLKQNHSTLERAVKRKPYICSGKQMTDQSFKKQCDINNIVSQFVKTGHIPTSNKIPSFGDFSEVPTLEEAFEVAHAAVEAFQALPADVRKLIDNDPSKLETFIADSENKEICIKYGLLENKPQVIDQTTETVEKEVLNATDSTVSETSPTS